MKKTLLPFLLNLVLIIGVIKVQAQTLSSSPTLSFTNTTGFTDNIAQDGEGGSVAISDINIQVLPINNSGAKLTADPLEYHGADWGTPSMITYGGTNSFFGWSINSDNGAEFSLVSFDIFNWGDWSGAFFTVQAFRNGTSLGTVSFAGNTDNNMVHLVNPGVLSSIFRNVDEVQVYQQSGANSWTGVNNIKVSSPSSTLPVRWQSFTASLQDVGILLKWSTAEESNTKNFVVEYSDDARHWSSIATIAAAGKSGSIQQYTYLHTTILNNMQYYRIIEHDIDGKENYSKVLAVNSSVTSDRLSVSPNPIIKGLLTVKLEKAERLQLFNIAGQMVWEKLLQAGVQQLNLPNLEEGLYIIRAGVKTHQVMVQ